MMKPAYDNAFLSLRTGRSDASRHLCLIAEPQSGQCAAEASVSSAHLSVRGLLGALVLTALFITVASPLSAQTSGADLFQKGQYAAAYAALWPAITAGEPEAAFYGLVIRRNGLDGRAPAKPEETAALWRILQNNRELMRLKLGERDVPESLRDAYLTALAQLDYFGPNPPSWPPVQAGIEEVKRARSISSSLAGPLRRFTPAMNFHAFLQVDAYQGREKSSFSSALRAAESGDRLAMSNLAWMYRAGFGTSKNNLRAAHWARQGAGALPPIPRSQNELGYCYEVGLGVSLDLVEAARWYKAAASQGYGPAKVNEERLKKGDGGTGSASAALENWPAF